MKKLFSFLMVSIITFGSLFSVANAQDGVVDTNPVEGIIITQNKDDETNIDTNTEIDNKKDEQTTGTTTEDKGSDKSQTGTGNYDGLKDDIYDGNVLKDVDTDIDGLFDRVAVKGRTIVEGVRKAAIPILIVAWMAMFIIAIFRILTGERGASGGILRAIFIITFAYCGIVYAELIINGLVKFFVGQ